MSKSHSDEVLDLIDGVSGLTVYDGTVPESPPLPYVVLFTDDGLDESDTLDAVPSKLTVGITLTSSGLTRTSVQIARDKAHNALVGVIPSVSGRSCSPIRQVNARRIVEDRDVTPHLLYGVSEYEFFSAPA